MKFLVSFLSRIAKLTGLTVVRKLACVRSQLRDCRRRRSNHQMKLRWKRGFIFMVENFVRSGPLLYYVSS